MQTTTNRRYFLKAVCGAAAAAALPRLAQAAPKKPNFVFFLVDDLGWADLACYGSKLHETPNCDRLAAEGMRFTDAYAACPVCSPTRASIMTGKYPTRVGITDWIRGGGGGNRKLTAPQDIHNMPLEEVTFPEALKEAGYKTFFAGKWHLNDAGEKSFLPEDQGFDINVGGHHRGSPPGGYFAPYGNPKMSDGPKGEYLTDRLAEESVKFLDAHTKANQDQPFLLYLAFYTVHMPIQPKPEYRDRFQKKLESLPALEGPDSQPEGGGQSRLKQNNPAYAAMVKSMDEAVGRVLDRVKALGLEDDTVVLFMSDNGGLCTLPGKRVGPTCNLPLRAGKGWCYEGGIREPMAIKWPGVTKPGSTCAVPVISNDFYPTILEIAGLPPKPAQHVDGVSLAPLLKGAESLPREALFWHYPHYHGSAWTPGGALRAGDWKLIEFFEEERVELYNLRQDLGERNDLAAKMPEKVAALRKLLDKFRQDTGAKMPTLNPAYKEKK